MAEPKVQRKTQRAAFTKIYNDFVTVFNDADKDTTEKELHFILLKDQWEILDSANRDFMQYLYEQDPVVEKDVQDAVNSHVEYKTKFLSSKLRFEKKFPDTGNSAGSEYGSIVNQPIDIHTPFKKPTMEIVKFDGSVGEWMPFWSHFKSYDEDERVKKVDKLRFLKMCMVKDSKADRMIKDLPHTAQSYDEALQELKDRFGRDRLQIQYYVRKLLTLVIQNASGGKKVDLAEAYDQTTAHIRALEILGIEMEKFNVFLSPLVEASLPEETLTAWQRSSAYKTGDDNDYLKRLMTFLKSEVEDEEGRTQVREFASQNELKKKEKSEKSTHRGKPEKSTDTARDVATASALVSGEEKKVCIFCERTNHKSVDCFKAKKMPMNERKKVVSEKKCCFVCLNPNHQAGKCRTKISCSWCTKHHSLLLCPFLDKTQGGGPSKDFQGPLGDKNFKNATEELNTANFSGSPRVFLKTLRVVLSNGSKKRVVRALIDDGSMRTYVSEKVVKELGLIPTGREDIIHLLFGGVTTKVQSHKKYLIELNNLEGTFTYKIEAIDNKVLCGRIPLLEGGSWVKELQRQNIFINEIRNQSDEEINLLIGADIAGRLVTGKKIDLLNGLTALETKLGWTVMGKNRGKSDSATEVHTMFVADAKISDLWTLDVLGIMDPFESCERHLREQKVKENFLKTVKLDENSRYSVDLPWKDDYAPVSKNYDIAKKRLENVTKKLKDSGSFETYDGIFKEWLKDGIIEIVPNEEIDNLGHYLPHRPVYKPESLTTPVRPVFDASAHEVGRPSLNQCLETGPNQIELIPRSILKFRENEIGLIADVKRAFLQVGINKIHQDYLRFFWYIDGKLTVLRHLRLLFGLTCSPFILDAIFECHFLKAIQAAIERKTTWTVEDVKKLQASFYVDNSATSVKDKKELMHFIEQSTKIMKTGSFELRGWEYTGDGARNDTVLVLGLVFDKVSDTLSINSTRLAFPLPEEITKRVILSISHKPFDPVGFTCPVQVKPKIIIKRLCDGKYSWDKPVDKETREEFIEWFNQLNHLSEIKIPRKLGKDLKKALKLGFVSLHVFCDASAKAYAVVIFIRVQWGDKVDVTFVGAKSRITPDNITIPRGELLAALIGSRFAKEVIETLDLSEAKIYYWSDSSTVLAWLKRDCQWGTFVWNRVKEIRQNSEFGTWNYVPGVVNPADLPSRGCDGKQLLESRWWEGPEWLKKDLGFWPLTESYETKEDEIASELKKTAALTTSLSIVKERNLCEKFSSYTRLIRFFTIMLRFKNFKTKSEKFKGKRLTFLEITECETKVLRELQKEMLLSREDLKLANIETNILQDGLMRVKTKIIEREDSFPFLNPIILDGNHEIVRLLIRETHEKLCHAGVQVVMCNLREKYWIIGVRKTVKSIVYNCITCKRYSSKPLNTEPIALPINRVRDAYIFEVTGVDFAGPIFLKGRVKGWICLYTCAVYRAVHLELVTSMSTNEFLGTLRRFIARRGRPNIVYSDNGTNFCGADNAFKNLNWDVISKYSSARQIDWRFNPPTAAWWGGWWERLIGMVKQILRRVLGRACLTYEELVTILCDCEATINSRPLTYVTEDPDDLKPLTPAMFLNEIQETRVPDIDLIMKLDLNARYKYRQTVTGHLRNRFRKEYLSQLVLKKSKKEKRVLREGDVVMMGDDSRKRLDWPLARVEQLILGRDNKPRVAVLSTGKGTFKRPFQRIYPLEISSPVSERNDLQEKSDLQEKLNEKLMKKNDTKKTDARKCSVDNISDVEIKTKSGRIVKKPQRLY